MRTLLLAVSMIVLLVSVAEGASSVPRLINYQAVVRDGGGVVVPDGTYDFTFNIYTVSSGGSAIWTEDQSLDVNHGIVNAMIGLVTTLDLDFDVQYWLGVDIDGLGEMTPRVRLSSSPYALRAAVADSVAGGGGGGDDGDWTISGVDIYSAVSGNVGIGTASPSRKLEVAGDAAIGSGIYGRGSGIGLRTSAGGYGVWVRNGGQVGLCGQSYWGGIMPGWGPDVHINSGGDTAYVWLGGSLSALGGMPVRLDFVGQPAGYVGPTPLSGIAGLIASSSGVARGHLVFYTASGAMPDTYPERMRITYNGRVGIGSTNPAEKLEVDGAVRLGTTSSSNTGTIRWSGSDFEGYDGASWLSLTNTAMTDPDWTINGNDMYSGVSGNVGVGASSPEEKLQVIGRINSKASEGETTALEIWGGADGCVLDAINVSAGFGMYFRVNSADALFVKDNGHVGIGTTDPVYRLHIVGSGANDAKIRIEGDADDDPSVNFLDGPGSQRAVIGWDSGEEALKLKAETGMGGETGLNIKTGGRVGIGTAAPNYDLHVIGDIFATGNIEGNFVGNFDDGDWIVSGIDLISALPGNIGIGIAGAPAQKLSVDGVIRAAYDPLELEYLEMSHGGGNAYMNWDGDGNLDMRFQNTTLMSLTQTGELGIGTSVPDYMLEVNGDAGFNDFIRHNDDENTYMCFELDRVYLYAAGRDLFNINGTSQNYVMVNSGSNDVDFHVKSDTEPYAFFVRGSDGNIGIRESNPGTELDVAGTTRTEVLEITGGSDLAEPFEMSADSPLEPGSVVVIDENNPGNLKLSSVPYDKRVAGVVSGAGGIRPGLTLSQEGMLDSGQNVALSGRVMCLVDASFGAVDPGDRLTTSPVPGYAMKVKDNGRAPGAVIGKAMSSLDSGRGLVMILVQPQ